MLKWLLIPLIILSLYPYKMSLSSKCHQALTTVEDLLAVSTEDDVVIRTQSQVRKSMELFDRVLDEYKFDELAVSYNGGKDCLVMLVIYMATLFKRLTGDELDKHKKLSCVLVNYEPQFPELIEFIQSSSREYNLDLIEYNTTMRDGFATYLTHHPSVEAIIVGTRRTDPHGSSLQQFQPTDHGWPKFIRVHPVLDWRYDEIWCFLKMTGTKYCPLYDEGYTSLGGVATTVKNPALKEGNGFRPAYVLSRGDEREREGRMSSR